jgi:FkbM family methyltransferase
MKKMKIMKLFILVLLILIIINRFFSYDNKLELSNNKIVNDKFISIWNEILHVSNEQELIDKQILFQTIKFMLKETEEDDPELIQFVRSSLIKPPGKNTMFNLNNKKKTDFSQIGQSKYIDSLLNSKRNGFFVEAGGYNGEDLSNSLYFELERNWTGLLIEAVPSLYKSILSKNRKSFTINCCIANKKPLVARFQLANFLSNRISLINENFQARVDQDIGTNNKTIIYVPCFSLFTILKAINVEQVDYFSLDVEGGELEVLKGIDFKKIEIKTFSIEHNMYADQKYKN